jgi:hypothetical protein
MKLLMYISNDLIDSISIEPKKIAIPGYISSFIRMLKRKHEPVISLSPEEPEFLVHRVSFNYPSAETILHKFPAK